MRAAAAHGGTAAGDRCPWRAILAPLAGLALLAAAAPACAGDQPRPFLSSNQHPFIQIFSVPTPPAARLAGAGAWRATLQFDLTNNSIAQEEGAESIVLDGETYRSTLSLSYGLSDRLEAGLVIPFVMHRRGVFDNFIEDWHDVFGLSNHKRTSFPRDRLNYAYTSPDAAEQLVVPAEGLGDIRLTLGWPIYKDAAGTRALALHAGLKLPSGDAAKLLGSGGTDLALQVSATDAGLLAGWKSTLFWSAGVLRLGHGEVLEPLRRDTVAIVSIGLGRPVLERIALKLQLDGHTSFYDTKLAVLGANTVQVIVGGEIDLRGAGTFDVGLAENLFTDTTPDLVFHLAWRAAL